MAEETSAAVNRKLKRKRSKEAIAKMVATKKKMRMERERGEELPLRVISSNVTEANEAAEFGAFLAAAWRVYKGL